MAYGDSDRAYLLGQDFGVTVVHNSSSVVGQLDEVTEDMLSGMVPTLGLLRSVLIATGSISPAANDAITVGGSSYTVYAVREEAPDGRLSRVFLAG